MYSRLAVYRQYGTENFSKHLTNNRAPKIRHFKEKTADGSGGKPTAVPGG